MFGGSPPAWRLLLFGGLALGLILAVLLAGHVNAACPGLERFDVKVGRDTAASSVDMDPIETDVASLAAVAPYCHGGPREPRIEQSDEFHTFTVVADVVLVKLEADKDLHIVLRQPDGPETMIAEAPDPTCAAGSVWLDQIIAVRRTLYELAGGTMVRRMFTPGLLRALKGKRVKVTGVGMYDRAHGQAGMAVSCLEIHPALSIEAVP